MMLGVIGGRLALPAQLQWSAMDGRPDIDQSLLPVFSFAPAPLAGPRAIRHLIVR